MKNKEKTMWIVCAGKGPKWGRSAYVDGNRTVFVPAAAGGTESVILLCASFDYVDMVVEQKHLYVSSDWLAKEFPVAADFCERAKKQCLEIYDKTDFLASKRRVKK